MEEGTSQTSTNDYAYADVRKTFGYYGRDWKWTFFKGFIRKVC